MTTDLIEPAQPGGFGERVEQARDWLLGNYLRKWVFLGILIGIVAGLGAILFFVAIDVATNLFLGHLIGYDPPGPRGEGVTRVTEMARPWLLPIVVGLGGLISGLIVFTLAPEAEGHGTDAAIEAFHQRGGRIRSRIPAIKLIASAVTIGSGGSAGREGPTAQIAAGFGSWLGDAFQLSPEDRRIAVAVGVGAGIGAIFKAPLGGALLSAEILYLRDFELEAIVPGFIASVIGYTIFASWSGWEPVFGTALGFQFDDPATLVWYAALGLLAGIVGVIYVRAFYGTRDAFHKIPVPPHVKPAIAGIVVGLIAMRFPEVLSMGYGWLQFAIEDNTAELAVGTMAALVALKIIATSLTIGSGGSGGVFAPGLFIGGMLGGAMWGMLHGHVPGMPTQAEPFVVVGMGALFGGIAKAPIAVMLMVTEMTGEFTMIVPAMIATSISYLVSGNVTIYESQVPTRGDSPAHRGEYTVPLIQTLTVGQAMHPADPLSPDTPIAQAREQSREAEVQRLPVVEHGRLVGELATLELDGSADGALPVRSFMTEAGPVIYPGDTLHTALQQMINNARNEIFVVSRDGAHGAAAGVVGVVSLRDVARLLDLQVNQLATRPENIRAAGNDPLRFVTVEETMSRKFRAVPVTATLGEVATQLARHGDHAALVVTEDNDLAGIVTVDDLQAAAASEVASESSLVGDIATRDVIVAQPGQFVADALAQTGADSARQLPVVEERGGHLVPVGVLRRNDVLVAYLRGRERLALSAARSRPAGDGGELEEVISTEIAVERASRANGVTLAELGLPRDAVVTAVERDGHLIVPRGQLRLLAGDRLRLLGSRRALAVGMSRFEEAPRV